MEAPDNLSRSVTLELQAKMHRLERSTRQEIIFPHDELEQIRQVNLWLQKILTKLKQKQTENPQKYKNENYEKHIFKLIIEDLDKLNLWKCKFSTSNRANLWDDLSPKETDSIYYMTPSGSSLRFKTIMFVKNNDYAESPEEHGLEYVVQEFATFVYFQTRYGGSNIPIIGNSKVKEIFDDKFQSLISQENPITENYQTGLVALNDKNGLWDVTTIEREKNNDISTHEGSLVNKIFFIK